MIEEIRLEVPLNRITHFIAIGGDVRFAASQIADKGDPESDRGIPREQFLSFCDEVERLDENGVIERFRLPAVEAETLVPALVVYRALLSETAARSLLISNASLRTGMLLDATGPSGRVTAEDFEQQVLASADALGRRYRLDRVHGQHVAALAARLFDELREEHGLGDRERLLLKVASLLHDVGIYVSLRAHHKHSQYILAESQIYYFLNGGDEQVYLASADWMTRNLDRRVELMFPVEQPAHKASVLHALRSMFRDNVKARLLSADGTYGRGSAASSASICRVQVTLQEEARRRQAQGIERAGVTFRPSHGVTSPPTSTV